MGKKKEIIDPVYDSAQRISYVMMNNLSNVKDMLILGDGVSAYRKIEELRKYAYEQYVLIMEENNEKERKSAKSKTKNKRTSKRA